MLEAAVVCATDTTIDLLHNHNYALWEDSKDQNGYMFTQQGEWQFYSIDKAQNRHVFEWNGQPSEGIYELSEDTIWLFQRIDDCWEKIRGLLTIQATNHDLTVKLLDKADGWHLPWFDVHLQFIDCDTIKILDDEQWSKTWDIVYQQRAVLIENSFPVCKLKDKKVKRILRRFVEETRKMAPDTTNISLELYFEKRKNTVCLIANSISTFSGKNIWGVLEGMEVPAFILDGEMNSRLFTKQETTIVYPICMEETKYNNGMISHDICDEYLYGVPIKSICIPLWKE